MISLNKLLENMGPLFDKLDNYAYPHIRGFFVCGMKNRIEYNANDNYC